MSAGNVLLQNLREFTVQIRNGEDSIVGTGFLVSKTGLIVTCRHVISAALKPEPISEQACIKIYLPQLLDEKKRKQLAKTLVYLKEYDDDVIVIQLESMEIASLLSKVAVLGDGDFSINNPFISYGYRALEKYRSGRAVGTILGSIEPPEGQSSLTDPIEMKSDGIDAGMSGSAVLDINRNLVVGIVTETWYSNAPKNRETCWAINAKILSLTPFQISLSREDYPKEGVSALPDFTNDLRPSRSTWNLKNAPAPITGWVGRSDILEMLSFEWESTTTKVVSLIGFGGQGKTSCARHWVDKLQLHSGGRDVSLFWWTFYDESSIEHFFDSALTHLSQSSVIMNNIVGTQAKAQAIAAIVKSKSTIFILDGIEVTQFNSDDEYGLFKDKSLRSFLEYLSDSSGKSFCVLTSRIPIIDLISFTTHKSIDIAGLTQKEGAHLLRKFGLKGKDDRLVKICEEWGGHPLTLSLLSSYVVQKLNGDLTRIEAWSVYRSTSFDPLTKILHEYEKILDYTDSAVVSICSVFRNQAPTSIFSTYLNKFQNIFPLISKTTISSSLGKLLSFRILQVSNDGHHYHLHPLVQRYFQLRVSESGNGDTVHKLAKETFLALAPYEKDNPTLAEMFPFIEAVYHACKSYEFDEAIDIFLTYVDKRTGYILFQCGAYETVLSLLGGFFENNDPTYLPLIKSDFNVSYILRALAVCHMTVGRLLEAKTLFDRSVEHAAKSNLMLDFAKAVQARCELNIHLGRLNDALTDANRAICVYQAANKAEENINYDSLSWGVQNISLSHEIQLVCAKAYVGWVAFLEGNEIKAERVFAEATKLLQTVAPLISTLRDLWGIYHSDFLRLTGRSDDALYVATENLSYATRNKIPEVISQCLRVIGDIHFGKGNIPEAFKYYDLSMKEARSFSHKCALIEILLSRSRAELFRGSIEVAWRYLQEALGYCVDSKFLIYLVDARILAAQALKKMYQLDSARIELHAALATAVEINYHVAVNQIKTLDI